MDFFYIVFDESVRVLLSCVDDEETQEFVTKYISKRPPKEIVSLLNRSRYLHQIQLALDALPDLRSQVDALMREESSP